MRTRLTVEMLLLNALPLKPGVCWHYRGCDVAVRITESLT